MIKKYHSYKDRRSSSHVKPLAFLMVEFLLLGLITWLAFIFAPLWASTLILVASLYFFMTSCLKRYRAVIERQKYYEEDNEDKEEQKEDA